MPYLFEIYVHCLSFSTEIDHCKAISTISVLIQDANNLKLKRLKVYYENGLY